MADEFERGLGYYGRDYFLQILRGPRTPWAAMQQARGRLLDGVLLDGDRPPPGRRGARRGHPRLLLETRDEDGWRFTDEQVRDQVMTLLFAGHDTATSTVTFLFYELARAPAELERLLAELDGAVSSATAGSSAAELIDGAAAAGHGGGRDPAPVPAGLDRPAARGEGLRVRGPPHPRRGRTSTTARGRAITCPRCSPTPRPSCPSASRPRTGRGCPRAPTSRSAAARGRASGCASASSRSRRSRRRSCSASPRAAGRLRAKRPPDADAVTRSRSADDRARTLSGFGQTRAKGR